MFGCCYPCFFSSSDITNPRPPNNVPLETIASTSVPNSTLSPLINPNLNVGDDRNRHVVNHMLRQQAYPEHAVSIEERLHNVIQLLELESERNAVAVILHGLGGIGKTTLADAIFARIEIKGFKVSKVRLFEDIGLKPEITKLQTLLLQDLKLGPNELGIQAIKGIWLQQDNELQLLHILAEQLDAMHNSLRVLALGEMTIVEGQCKSKFQ
eukprot:Gb_22490 [translate_table: standard]